LCPLASLNRGTLSPEKTQKRCMVQRLALKRSVYSHENLITELEVFPKDFHNYLRMDHHTNLHLLSLVTPFIAKEDMVLTTHTRGKRLGKSGLKEEK
jgi:hypothetical protein